MHINELLKEETFLNIYHKSIFDSVECVSIGTPKHIAKLVLHGMHELNKKLHGLPYVNCKDIMQADENGELGVFIAKNPNEVFIGIDTDLLTPGATLILYPENSVINFVKLGSLFHSSLLGALGDPDISSPKFKEGLTYYSVGVISEEVINKIKESQKLYIYI